MGRKVRSLAVVLAAACWLGIAALGQEPLVISFVRAEETVTVRLADYAEISGTVAYQGPVMGADENWKAPHAYSGVPIAAIVEAIGGLADGATLGIVALDGWYKILPRAVVYGDSPAGTPILATSVDGVGPAEWEDAPMLVFLPDDERFSNDDMLAAFGPERSHHFGDQPSTTGMMVKGAYYLVVDYDGTPLALPPRDAAAEVPAPEGVLLTLVRGGATSTLALSDLEAMAVVAGEGTFTNSAGVDYTATYAGVPLMNLIGNVPADSTVRVTASDGYSMNYAVAQLADTSEGVWILAFEENRAYMPPDPGPLRIVRVGPDNPHFTSSLSAKMVERIELLGTYEAYSLLATGAVERRFDRAELEAGIGCPCHTATVSVTSKGETHTYTGLPLWRLIAYVDDGLFPAAEEGIHYNDEDFNDALAATGYMITLAASDGYTQTVASDLVARDDRFVVAFKMDGVFLDPASSGYMRFVFDDSVALPDGVSLKSVKSLAAIALDL